MVLNKNDNILTLCRINDKFPIDRSINITNNTIYINNKEYKVDYVLNQATQIDVFNIVKEFIMNNINNYLNCTIFAYGQTGSGKTYTIQGDKDNYGLITHTLHHLHNFFPYLKLSFIEIYNEEINDLSVINKINLNLREITLDQQKNTAIKTQIFIDNLNIYKSMSYNDSIQFYINGLKNRKISATACNKKSSRSHSIFTIYLKFLSSTTSTKLYNKIIFVDLAGSEKIKDLNGSINTIKQYKNNKIFKESITINKSLMNLGIVVNVLAEKSLKKYIPYRDSKLTFLLKDSLQEDSKLCIIGNVNLQNINDSINTLQFLQRTKLISITTDFIYNHYLNNNNQNLITNLKLENEQLKLQLKNYNNPNNYNVINKKYIYNLITHFKNLEISFYKLKDEINILKTNYYNKTNEFDLINKNLEAIKVLLQKNLKNYFKKL